MWLAARTEFVQLGDHVTTAVITDTVTLAWDTYVSHQLGSGPTIATRRVPVPANTDPAKLTHIPGLRNARIETAPTALGDVPAPILGWGVGDDGPDDVPMFPAPRAALAVKCPKCRQPGGLPCQSTGGGNRAYVATHRVRLDRVKGWTNAVQEHAELLVKAVGHHGYARDDLFAVFERAAAPMPAKGVRPSTPKGVKLSEKQAETIENLVHFGGIAFCPTTHFHGDHETRQTLLALESKNILAQYGTADSTGERKLRLTAFGWQVYRQHRLIIRRLDDAEVDRLETASNRKDDQ